MAGTMKESLKANKKLGQHFLKDKNIIQAIIKTMPENTSCIVEIGPGLGAITHQLLGLQKKNNTHRKRSSFCYLLG